MQLVDRTALALPVAPALTAGIEEAARKQAAHEEWQRANRAFASEVSDGKMTLQDLSEARREAVTELLKTMRHNPRNLLMQQQREARSMAAQHAKERAAAGMASFRPKQEVYTAVVRTHLDGCESGAYPTAKATAEATVGNDATRLLRKGHSKSELRTALKQNEGHPAMKRINSIVDSSAVTATVSGSVSTCLGALANSHKLAKRLELIEKEQRRAQQREKELTARIASLEARRDLEDDGKSWKGEVARLMREQPGTSMRALGRAVGVSDTAIRKHLKAIGQ